MLKESYSLTMLGDGLPFKYSTGGFPYVRYMLNKKRIPSTVFDLQV